MKKNDFETIFTSNYVMNIQGGIGNRAVSRKRAYSTEKKYYFGRRQTNTPFATHNYGPIKSKFEVRYYKHTYSSPEKGAHTRKKLEK